MYPVITEEQFIILHDYVTGYRPLNFFKICNSWYNGGNYFYRVVKTIYNTFSGKYSKVYKFYRDNFTTMVVK